jgi:hypothetical protein
VLAERWGTEFVTPETMIGTMATIVLPASLGSTADDAVQLRHRLLFEDRIEVQVHAWKDRLHARISGQIYNDLDEIERFASAILERKNTPAIA